MSINEKSICSKSTYDKSTLYSVYDFLSLLQSTLFNLKF